VVNQLISSTPAAVCARFPHVSGGADFHARDTRAK